MSDQDQTTNTPQENGEEISLLDLLIVLAKHKMMILKVTVAGTLAATVISVLLPNIYTGTTKILPPQQSQSTANAMLAQLGAQLGGPAGVAGGALNLKNPNDLYVGMLKSRTVADSLIDRFDLKKNYDEDTYYYARKLLEKHTAIIAGKDGIITIEVDDKDPKRAADMANAYVDELDKLTQTLAVTEASQRRLFFENQLKATREQLAQAEAALERSMESQGMAGVEFQGRSLVETAAQLRAQITATEVKVDALRVFATENNPDVVRLRREIDSMKSALAKLESGDPKNNNQNSSPAGMENLRRLRDVKYFEALVDNLTKQFEAAKIDEAKNATLIQILDKAIVPEKKSKPKRRLIVTLTALIAGFMAILLAFIKEVSERAKIDPGQVERLNLLRRYIWMK